MTEKEEEATETKISNKFGQGNPLWAQLCLRLTERAELQRKVGVDSCSSALFSAPAPTGFKWNQHELGWEGYERSGITFLLCLFPAVWL